MSCNNFKCVNLVGGECEELGGDCIGDLCENWGECLNCQRTGEDEECWKE